MIEPDDPGMWPPATTQRSSVDELIDQCERDARIRRQHRAMDLAVARWMQSRDTTLTILAVSVALLFASQLVHWLLPHPAAPVPVHVEVEAK